MHGFIASMLLLAASSANAAHPTRTVHLDENSLTEVRTALGHSTLLQFQTRPKSAVVGDQDAFRIEYVGTSLSIKPLLPRASTNLFVFTDSGSFNFRLLTVAASQADYRLVVQRKRQVSLGESTELAHSVRVKDTPSRASIQIRSLEMGLPPSQKAVVLRFELNSREAKELYVSRESFEIRCGSLRLLINQLVLPAQPLSSSRPGLKVAAVVRTENLRTLSSCKLHIRIPGASPTSVPLPFERLWKAGRNHGKAE